VKQQAGSPATQMTAASRRSAQCMQHTKREKMIQPISAHQVPLAVKVHGHHLHNGPDAHQRTAAAQPDKQQSNSKFASYIFISCVTYNR
jgi:hypothetical protein